MGDCVEITAIEVLYGGRFQIDFKNTKTGEQYRCFCDAGEFFGMIGDSMQRNLDASLKKWGFE